MKGKEKTVIETYEELIEKINVLDYHYYTLDNPLMTDKDYDDLYDRLLAIEKKHPHIVKSYSPTKKVGGDLLNGMSKKEHTFQLYSLNKAQSFEELRKFITDTEKALSGPQLMTLEWKFDGLSVVVRYENGLLVEGRTRGNGKIGEVITEQIKTIKDLPLKIDYKGIVEVQGEIVMPLDKFKEYNDKIKLRLEKMTEDEQRSTDNKANEKKEEYKLLSNPRNGASGAIRQLDPKITAKRPLSAVFYNVGYIENKKMDNQLEIVEFLKENKFNTGELLETYIDSEVLEKRITELEKYRKTLNYEVDGLVIKINDLKLRETLGYTAKYPKSAIAFKFEAEEKTSVVEDVVWEVGRTGRITPVAILEPIEFDGVIVRRATLNNLSDIKNKNILLGGEVVVRRSNDVIPEITRSLPGTIGKVIEHPKACPSCNGDTTVELPFVLCGNREGCPTQNIKAWKHFVSRDAMNITGLSDKTLMTLFESGLLQNISDLYLLTVDKLKTLERLGEKSAMNIIESIEQSKETTLDRFIYALGINLVGKGTSERLSHHFVSIDKIIDAKHEDFIQVVDVGDKAAKELECFFKNKVNLEIIEKMFSLGVTIKENKPKTNESGLLSGKLITLTGKMPRPRKEMEELVKTLGGKISTTVNKKTDILICGEKAGSKLNKARELNIEIMDVTQLMELTEK